MQDNTCAAPSRTAHVFSYVQSINNKVADGAMVRHSSDESEASEMAGDYSKAIRCAAM